MSMLGNFAVNNSQQNNPVTFQVSDSAFNKTVEYEKLSTRDYRIPKVTGKIDDGGYAKGLLGGRRICRRKSNRK